MFRFQGPRGRARSLANALALLICSFFSTGGVAQAQSADVPGAPRWLEEGVVEARDGLATVRWAPPEGAAVFAYRLVESIGGRERSTYLEGRSVTLHRAVPGLYRFSLQACVRDAQGLPACGPPSAPIEVAFGDELLLAAAQAGAPSVAAAPQPGFADSIPGGPDQLRPGLWYNPDREGHGYSFFWANRLALPESHASHGFAYDLLGVWYTYEARQVSLAGDPGCENDLGAPCEFIYSDYRPLAARLRLVQDGASSYAGGIFVTRNGQEALAGSARLTFGPDNGSATIDWAVDFRFQHHAAIEDLVFLAGSDPAETINTTHHAGIWEPVDGAPLTVVANVGSYSEAVEVLFEDAHGDPGWIQAVNEGEASPFPTDLCFYYVAQGFAPDDHGTIAYHDSGCASLLPADAANHNGERGFTGFETARAWVDFSLPGDLGAVRLGSAAAPAELRKTANFHRIWFTAPEEGCLLRAERPWCELEVSWFTDGDYPRATAWLHARGGGSRKLAEPTGSAVLDLPVRIDEVGDYQFELRMGDASGSTLIAGSAFLRALWVILEPTTVPVVGWADEAARRVRLDWAHPEPAMVDRYRVEETPPGGAPAMIHEFPSSDGPHIEFDHGAGPWGTYRYRVRACTDMLGVAECSDWSAPVSWVVDEPGEPPETVAHPWGDHAGGAGSMVTGLALNYAMGYHFRPEVDGRVTELGGLFDGAKTVRLFDRASRALLAEAVVAAGDGWRYAPIAPVAVTAGSEYTVAVYLAGSGGSYLLEPQLPVTRDGVTILGSTWVSTASDPAAVPVNLVPAPMYGQADIGFVADAPPVGPRPLPPASPETPPAPAAKPDFAIDAASASVGVTAGEFGVDPNGAATYRIPLPTAPGAGGFAPRLELQYNSQGPNDVAGVGWSIGGLSSIARCPQTVEQDGVPTGRGVSLDNGDRFCLDGRRLVVVDGDYGADGAEYRAEIDEFLRIRSYGNVGGGPAWFRVWHGDGSFSDYGATADSRIEARAGAEPAIVLNWALSRSEDASGNFIEYVYDERADGPVEAVLERVRYTGNHRAGTAPYAELRFHYATGRGDVPVTWVRGVAIGRDRLLTRVDSLARVRAGDPSMASFRSFFLGYGQDGFGRRVLESVTECSDAARSHCFPATSFDWLKNEHEITLAGARPLGDLFERDFRGLQIADVNGDGFNDLLLVEGRRAFTFSIAVADGQGGFRRNAVTYPLPGNGEKKEHPVDLRVVDLDADGLDDVVYPRSLGDRVDWVARLSDGSGFGPERIVVEGCCELLRPRVAGIVDFDGDGMADLLTDRGDASLSGQGDLVILLNASSADGRAAFAPPRPVRVEYDPGLFPQDPQGRWQLLDEPAGFTWVAAPTPGDVQAFDYNGDGAVDLLARIDRRYVLCETTCNTTMAATRAALAQGFTFDGFDSPKGNEEYVTVSFYIVFVSDGLDRYVQRHVVATDGSQGCAVDPACLPWQSLPAAYSLQAVDINGDGLADLAWRDARNAWWHATNTGAAFGPAQRIAQAPDREHAEWGRFADLNGDGLPEFLLPEALDRNDANWIVHANDLGAGFAAGVPSQVRLGNPGDGDASVLYDFNGDGATDNLHLDLRNGVVDGNRSALYPGRNFLGGATHQAANVIREIRDGAGQSVRIGYRPMTDRAVYTPRRDAASLRWGRGSRVFDLLTPFFLVDSVERSAPAWADAAGTVSMQYHYAGARAQAGGRGFLGFAETVRWSPQGGVRVNTRYRQDFPFTGLVADVTQALATSANGLALIGAPAAWPAIDERSAPPDAAGAVIGHRVTDWRASESTAGAWRREAVVVLERNGSPQGELLRKTLTRNRHAEFGRVVESVAQTWGADGAPALLTVTTRNSYLDADLSRWRLNRLSAVAVEHARPGTTSVVRRSAFAYDAGSGLRIRETTEPGDAKLEVATVHRRDAFGNIVETTVTAAGVAPRVSRLAFDPLGRFALRETNAFGQVTMQVHDWNAAGTALEVSDIDGVRTFSVADPMGRVFANWTETGARERTVRRWGAGDLCPASAAFRVETTAAGKPSVHQCFDTLGRTVRTARQGFDGRWIMEDTGYDALGRPERVSEPYFDGESRYWNRTGYDALGRIVSIEAAAADDIRRSYGSAAGAACGLDHPGAVATVNALGQSSVEVHNALGERIAVADAACGVVDYRYDAIGNLVEVTGVDGATVRMSYDRAGRRVAMDDPDKGYWQYAWNGLGEMTRQLDAKGQALDYRYDELGRVVQRLELSGVADLADAAVTVVNSEETRWQNSVANGVTGKGQPLSSVYRVGAAGATIHRRDYEYDAFGRQARVVTTFEGRSFVEETTYDAYGRVFQQFDASGDSRGVRHVYNGHGHLVRLQEAREGAEGQVYRTVLAMNARGAVTAARLGNGVETFTEYDPASGALVRLAAYDADGRELQEVDYLFDALGNLQRRVDRSNGRELGERFAYDALNRLVEVTYDAPGADPALTAPLRIEYDAAGNITWKSDVGRYDYGASAGPHAVTRAGDVDYRYDANGNQVAGAGRDLEYSVFDKVTRIAGAGAETRFAYGIAHQRIRREDSNGVDGERTTWYLDTADYVETANGAWFKRRIVDAAVVDFHPASNVSATRYFVRDHLGSVHNVTDDSGRLESATWMSFDAFGQRRSPDWSGPMLPGALAGLNALTTRGFTGHEHVDALGLVNMNGRLYDPRLGRFLQADPLVQQSANGQNLNRYSYAANNPLSLTDPSGYSFKRFIKRWGRLIVAIALSIVLPGSGGVLASSFGIGNIYAQAAITGFVAGAVASGTLKGAVIGSLVSLAVTGVIEAYSAATQAEGLASADNLMPPESSVRHLYGNNDPPAGLYRINVAENGNFADFTQISSAAIKSDDVIFTNGMMNGFRDAVRNGTSHLHQAGLLRESYVLNFNPTGGFLSDVLESSRDLVGAHTGLTQSSLARNLAGVLHDASVRGVTGLQLVGHSQGGAITASALRYAGKAGLSLRSLAGGGVSLHGAPVNAWMARTRLFDRAGVDVVSRAQFGDAVHVLGGLNVANPLEVLISLYRTPALFSPDASVSPHSLPCGGSTALVCAY